MLVAGICELYALRRVGGDGQQCAAHKKLKCKFRPFFGYSHESYGIFATPDWSLAEVDMRARLKTFAVGIIVGAVTALAAPTASAMLPANAATVQQSLNNYDNARLTYVASVNVYLSHSRMSKGEYAIALKNFTMAQGLLQIAKREIAKTFQDSIKVAQIQNKAATKAAKTPEQRAAAAVAWTTAVTAAATARDNAIDSLKQLPAAPAKPVRNAKP